MRSGAIRPFTSVLWAAELVYVLFSGELSSEDILDVLRRMADYVLSYEGEIPGYSPRDCGNYLDNNLTLAKLYMKKYKEEVLDNPSPERMRYPD